MKADVAQRLDSAVDESVLVLDEDRLQATETGQSILGPRRDVGIYDQRERVVDDDAIEPL